MQRITASFKVARVKVVIRDTENRAGMEISVHTSRKMVVNLNIILSQ